MKKIILSGAILAGLIIGCRQLPTQPDNSIIEPMLPAVAFDYAHINSPYGKLSLYYEDSTLIDSKKATIGRVLFYDKALSHNNSTSCASCHIQANGFADVTAFSVGFNGQPTKRNSLSISNLFDVRKTGYFWDTRESKIEEMVFKPIEDHIEMGFENISLITEKISNLPYYKKLFKDCYGDELITQERMRESLGQFLFSIVNANSKFDRGQKNNFADFTTNEKNGMNLFVENGCSECHFIHTSFSPAGAERDKMANIGLDVSDKDKGKEHQYRIPDLRNVANTAPYMHDGRFTTLNQVVNHYGFNVQPNPYLSEELKNKKPNIPPSNYAGTNNSDIANFLKTLNDDFTTVNERYSNPFKN
ncbi:MAG: cytochrome-c peroxidase [Bacteroidia bacterium]|nr:cytochrome-c peroxidase [Bacteroidia bacterium]